MPSGGARNRSGPQPDPQSLTSARRGLVFTALPREGYDGEVPDFPIPEMRVFTAETSDGVTTQVYDADLTAAFRDRELELWATAWTYPQAAAWAQERWRWGAVAMWVRTTVVCESYKATAADKGSVHRFADQIGMTPAGLRENGWAISRDEVKARRETPAAGTKAAAPRSSSRDRLTVVDAAAGE